MTTAARRVEDPAELAALFDRHRDCHLYGLADLSPPFWAFSTWWRRGDAAVGVVPLPDSSSVAFYAISPAVPAATLELLAAVHEAIPAGAVGSGPVGMVERLCGVRSLEDLGTRVKQVVTRDALVEVPAPSSSVVVPLGRDDLDELRDLHATDPGAAFLVASMLDDGRHLGVRERGSGTLVAAAGTHVLDRHHRVAAIGAVLTRPSHRGQGLAAAVTSRLAAQLLDEGLTVGLNVGEANHAARRVYDRLGFRTVHRYEEARLL